LCDEQTMHRSILPFLAEADQLKERAVVHCSAGSGRTGHVLAAWLVYRHGLAEESALHTVSGVPGVYRHPQEAVDSGRTRQTLYHLLGTCHTDGGRGFSRFVNPLKPSYRSESQS
jgi:hypothetical protein